MHIFQHYKQNMTQPAVQHLMQCWVERWRQICFCLHTCAPLSFSHQTAGGGNPCPRPRRQTRLKGWADRDTESHAQQILPHSLQQQQKAQRHLSGGEDREASSALIIQSVQNVVSFWSHDSCLMLMPLLNIWVEFKSGPTISDYRISDYRTKYKANLGSLVALKLNWVWWRLEKGK